MLQCAPYKVDSTESDLTLAKYPSASNDKRCFAIAIGWNEDLKDRIKQQNPIL